MPTLPRTIRLIAVGKIRAKHWLAAGVEYERRLMHYVRLDIVEVKDWVGKGLPDSEAMIREGERLLAALKPDDCPILLAETGREPTSPELAAYLDRLLRQDSRDVAFLIGGPLGVSQAVRDAARDQIALSRLTFTHEMARVILLEQLYRAFTLLSGEGYHK